jgi:hypothetical protein
MQFSDMAETHFGLKVVLFMLNLHAAARAILLEDGQDPRCVLGPLDVFQGILA